MVIPRKKTVRQVVEYLRDELGLTVYGPAINLETGEQFAQCMDYDVDAIEKFRKLGGPDKVWSSDDE